MGLDGRGRPEEVVEDEPRCQRTTEGTGGNTSDSKPLSPDAAQRKPGLPRMHTPGPGVPAPALVLGVTEGEGDAGQGCPLGTLSSPAHLYSDSFYLLLSQPQAPEHLKASISCLFKNNLVICMRKAGPVSPRRSTA